ncbi:MAG: TRAM domain-containing protein, partial [Helcococcus sp.]|nr:TRAM domain-containing protein [Helcococcus sp.]
NDLANSVKTVVIPGERMLVNIIKEGKEKRQGLAYLDDGTMIVVEEGKDLIGEEVEVMVTTVLQTSAGKMIFTKIV